MLAEAAIADASPGLGDPPHSAETVLDGKYLLEEQLGSGALGAVFRAYHLGLERSVAIKRLHRSLAESEAAAAQVAREARALGRLHHPNIVDVFDVVRERSTGLPYIVMELVEGPTLSALLTACGPLAPGEGLAILEQVASALDAAHRGGVLHRDLKPDNILLSQGSSERLVAKVADFGLAAFLGVSPPVGEIGTALYCAPELWRGAEANPASDLYAFAALAFELLTGRPPFAGSVREVRRAHLEDLPPLPPRGAPGHGLAAALLPALAKQPEARPASAVAVVASLRCAQLRQARRRAAPHALAWAAFATALAASAVLALPPVALAPIELRSYDARQRAAPAVAPDPRILLVTLGEGALPGGRLLGERAEELARDVELILAAGASSVALDLELSPRFGASEAFSALVLRRADVLTLAASSHSAGGVGGISAVQGLAAAALGPERAGGLFGFTHVSEDADGVNRRSRLRFRDERGGEQPSFALHAAVRSLGARAQPLAWGEEEILLDHRVDPAHIPVVALAELEARLAREPELFRGRLVLVGLGLEAAPEDLHYIPDHGSGRRGVSGLVLQALVANTLLAGVPLREGPPSGWVIPVSLASWLLAWTILLGFSIRRVTGLALGGALVYQRACWELFLRAGLVLPLTSPLVLTALVLALGCMMRHLRIVKL